MGWIELDGAVNVRDLGSLATDDGLTTVPGRLLRADNLQDLSPADVRLLVGELGLTTVVDLRSPVEVESEGPGPLTRVGSVRLVHLSLLPEYGKATDAAAEALAVRRDGDRYPVDPLCGHYLGYLEDRPDQVVAALRNVAEAPGAAMVHCAAGKDRTGVVVALALSVVGVRRDTVIDDYTATAERISAVLRRLRSSRTYDADLDTRPDDDHKPRARTMRAFLEQVDVRYGGVLGWLSGHGFGPGDVQALRAKMLTA